MAAESFSLRSVSSSANLNWVFLTYWAVALFSALLFSFYFSQILGFIVSFVLERVLWKRYKIQVKVQAFKVSFLGGRIFVKNVTIITGDMMILVHTGWFTWRYWLYNVRKQELVVEREGGNLKANAKLPTRYLLEIEGLEVFMFNRRQAYDSILEQLGVKSQKDEAVLGTSSSHTASTKTEEPPDSALDRIYKERMVIEKEQMLKSRKLECLPLTVHVTKGSLLVGNNSTPSLLVIYLSTLAGTVMDMTPSVSKFDHYRSNNSLEATDLQVYLKPNIAYKRSGEIANEMDRLTASKKFNKFRKLWKHTSKEVNVPGTPQEESQWHGLERYLTQSRIPPSSATDTSASIEYARYTHMAEASSCHFKYYYDVPGLVPPLAEPTTDGADIGNGGIAPQMGLEIDTQQANFHYGPWTERQRGPLHHMIFPVLYRDVTPKPKLTVGMRRQFTDFKIGINFQDETIIQIPLREPSKDSNYQQKYTVGTRPFGWVELKVAKGSKIVSSASYVPQAVKGWDNTLDILLKRPEISTSVNHDVLYMAAEHRIMGSTGYPLQWNGKAVWTFDQTSKGSKLFMLREHFTLISDLFRDFSSGEPQPYNEFRPFDYDINWKVFDFAICLNANERNIIDNPIDHTNNVYVSLKGKELNFDVHVPLDEVWRKSTDISFDLNTDEFSLMLEAPPYSTLSNFMDSPEIGKAYNFKMNASYIYYSDIELDAIDTVKIDCTCDDTTLECYGVIIKYAITLKENYFGDHIHFRTLSEFTEEVNASPDGNIASDRALRTNDKNPMDVMVTFCVTNGCIVLPVHLYDCGAFIGLTFETLDIDFRLAAFYMDVQADLSETSCTSVDMAGRMNIFEEVRQKKHLSPGMILDGISVHGHRMFGPQPEELTYFCRWTFDCGPISIESNPSFINSLAQAGVSFGYGYKDTENSLQMPEPHVDDILNFKMVIPTISIKLKCHEHAFQCVLSEVSCKLSDQCTLEFNKRVDIRVRSIDLKAFTNGSPIGSMHMSLYVTNFVQKRDGAQKRLAQLDHVQTNDGPSHRVPFLLTEEYRNRQYKHDYMSTAPPISLPNGAEPILPETADLIINSYSDNLRGRLLSTNENVDESKPSKLRTSASIPYFEAPDYDPTCKRESFTIKLSPIAAKILPEMFDALADLVMDASNFGIYRVLDDLQDDAFEHIEAETLPSLIRAKIECPSVSVNVGSCIGCEDGLDVELYSLMAALSSAKHPSEVLGHIEADQVVVKAIRKQKDVLSFAISGAHYELCQSNGKLTTKLDFDDSSTWIVPEETSWFANYCDMISGKATRLQDCFSQLKSTRQKAQQELIYQAIVAGETHNIVYDPPCVTKPSYLTRFTDNHLRLQNSWRVMMRLRYVLKSLPPSWTSAENAKFKKREWSMPEDGAKQVFEIFMNWRQWESSNIQDSYVLRHTFLKDTEKKKDLFAMQADLRHFGISIFPLKDVFVLTDIRFDLNQEKLEDTIKEQTSTLIDEPVEDGLNVTVYVGRFNTNLVNLKDAIPHISTCVQTVRNTQKQCSNHDKPPKPYKSPVLVTLKMVVPFFRHSVGIDRSRLNISGHNLAMAISNIQGSDGSAYFTSSITVDAFQANATVADIRLLDYHCSNNTLTVSNTGDFKTGSKTVVVGNDSATITCAPGSRRLAQALEYFMEHEYPMIEPLVSLKSPAPPSSSRMSLVDVFDILVCNITASVRLSNTKLNLEIISPIVYDVEVKEMLFEVKGNKQGIIYDGVINHIITRIVSRTTSSYEYIFTSLDRVEIRLAVCHLKEILDTYLSVDVGTGRVQLRNELPEMILQGYHDFEIARSNCIMLDDSIKSILTAIRSADVRSVQRPQSNRSTLLSDLLKITRCYFTLAQDKVDLVCPTNENQIVIAVSQGSIRVSTYDKSARKAKLCGSLQLPSIKVLFANTDSNSKWFPIFDMDLRIDVINLPSTELPQMNIISNYCRFVLNPYYADQIFQLYINTEKSINKVKTQKRSRRQEDNANPTEAIEAVLRWFAINITSNNFCFGWLFSTGQERYRKAYDIPGLVFGFESAKIIGTHGAGTMSLEGMYLAVAHGDGPLNYFATLSEKESANRIFFERFGLMYAVDHTSGRDLKVKVEGDIVDVRWQTGLLLISKPLVESLSFLQERVGEVRSREVDTNLSESAPFTSKPLLKLDSINCTFKFAGAQVMINYPDIKVNGQSSTLFLQSPQLSSVFRWALKTPQTKRHIITVSSRVSRTDNRLTHECVPVISEIVQIVRNAMRKTTSKSVELTPPMAPAASSIKQWEKITKDVSINFDLKVEPQRLELTCEPKANVTSIVSSNEIHIVVNTDSDSFSGLLYVEKLTAQLQHAYSKEASASIVLRNLTLNTMMTEVDKVKRFTIVTSSDDLDALVNIQQRQDLDVFRDLWIPGDRYEVSPETDETSGKTLGTLLREVSTTSAFPWSLLVLLKRIQVKIRLGSSLGTLTAYADNLWATAEKSINWDQNFRLQVDTVRLDSKGRMNGLLKTEKLRVSSMISWKQGDIVLDVPQVLLSTGCKLIQARTSLDYHPFLVFELGGIMAGICNRRVEGEPDIFVGAFSVVSSKLFFTALAAANLVDIYTIGLRISHDIRASYKQVMNDRRGSDEPETHRHGVSEAFLNAISKLRTELLFDLGDLEVQVFPSSLTDTQAMVVRVGSTKAKFYQDSTTDTLEDQIALSWRNAEISLSTFKKQPVAEDLTKESTDEYIRKAVSARGGTIIAMPSLRIEMHTWRKYYSDIVDYLYSLQFGDKIDVRWNLGSVYFIRQMWYSHASALKMRLQTLKFFTTDEYGGESYNDEEDNYKESLLESVNLEDRLKNAEEDEEYVYRAISEPNIEKPQLRELGDATPPLEWFGVHQGKFPILTYKLAIESLQKAVDQIETQYSSLLI